MSNHKMTWLDNEKRLWSCRPTIGDLKRLKANGVDIADPTGFEKIFASTLDQIEMLAELMRPQWEAHGLRYEQFAEIMIESEGRLQEIQQAFICGLTDFFRRIGEGHTAAIVEKAWNAAQRGNEAKLRRAQSAVIDSLIDKAIDREEREFAKVVSEAEAKISGSV